MVTFTAWNKNYIFKQPLHKPSINIKHYTIMIKKELYTTPSVKTLVVRFEGIVCLSGGKAGAAGRAGASWTKDDDYYDYGDLD